jgi:thiamine-monophosphate kinase
MKTLAELGENELVKRLIKQLAQDQSVLVGPGDDCAVVQHSSETLLLKTDVVVEGLHFLRSNEPERIGRKAIARAISDIGAMGGSPRHALVTLLAPSDLDHGYVERLYAGMQQVAKAHGISIVGGETASSPVLILNVSLTGYAPHPVLRSGASAGDCIIVTGNLGGSIQGHHLDFEPRVTQGQWLAQHRYASAMMDLSDGLAKDLPRLAQASQLSYRVHADALPCNPGCSTEQAWADGEDYELLFTCHPSRWTALKAAWPVDFPALTQIGEMLPLSLAPEVSLRSQGWEHFVQLPAV